MGYAYLEFARTDPGLFDTAFATLEHALQSAPGDEPVPFDLLKAALDELVEAPSLTFQNAIKVTWKPKRWPTSAPH